MSDVKHTTDWEEIIELVDQEIPASRGEYLKEHLKECKECQDKLAALDKLSGTVHKWDVPQLPVQRAERMLQNVQSQNLAKPGIIAALIEKLGWPGTVAAAGVVLAACALLLALLARTQTISLSTAILQRPRPKSIALSPYAANLHEQNATPSGDQLLRSGNSWSETTAKVQSHAEPDVPAPMIARTVSLSIVAKDLTATRRSFEAILARHHGYAADLTADAQQDSA